MHGSAGGVGGNQRISFEEFPNEFEATTRILYDCTVSGEKKSIDREMPYQDIRFLECTFERLLHPNWGR
ncbi:hypothetical protein DLM78_09455 [Leptospira stimsonii]|uniref:Uncharacterized protein n=1 Tax=Leptospira stimsonii TaxID=2202203 RepID=A0A8B3CPG5_9LEPT|nr:hypothetical protein DLM78_09455 [Leptospira stimsonii]